MNQFTTKYADHLQGTLSGFDRLVFHGTVRTLASVGGMKGYLSYCNILWKDFADHAQNVTERIKQAALLPFQQSGRPIEYMASPKPAKKNVPSRSPHRTGSEKARSACLPASRSVAVTM